ncbi:hypothetical protein BDQ12DRAFT_729996 [Crucibulum laeve]|uniref:Uncharacterized protein n=1 Tax=Crucibulum laeve TaxID=68775 RepID=A0A5C3LD99_9AGAR|nr:hypothetical protein BDQ12DRAFT_729996 [Crucibulum laeve]
MAQPQHILPHYMRKIRFAIDIIANTNAGNPDAIETPYYAPWDIALNDIVCATRNCIVHPQPALRTPEDGARIPDFAIALNLSQLGWALNTRNRRGFYYIMGIENKRINPEDNANNIQANFESNGVITQVRNQAKYICSYTGQDMVVCIYAIGLYWRYTCLYKRCMSEIYAGPSESMTPGAIEWSQIYTLGTPASDDKLQWLKTHAAQRNGWPINTSL